MYVKGLLLGETMGILEREEQSRRDTILGATETIFFEKVLRSGALNGAAERAEVSKGTICLRFASEEEHYSTVMTRGWLLLLNAFPYVRPKGTDPVGAPQSLSGISNLRKRSSTLKEGSLVNAISVIGPADSDGIHGRNRNYLVDFISCERARIINWRTTLWTFRSAAHQERGGGKV